MIEGRNHVDPVHVGVGADGELNSLTVLFHLRVIERGHVHGVDPDVMPMES